MAIEPMNVDLLFEKNTFESIEQIKNSLQDNANKKKDELRQIIGQSYRDLISISNVIENIFINCDNLSHDINSLKLFCDQSKLSSENNIDKCLKQEESQLIIDTNQINENNLNRICLKIIINSPNQILDLLNKGDILAAALLFKRTKYLCEQFDENDRKSFQTLTHHIIFLKKIEKLINHEYLTIINYRSNRTTEDQQLFRTLYAICLIREQSIDQVISEFLFNRRTQCIKLFDGSESSEDAYSKILIFFKIIFNTLEIIFNLYNSVDELTAPSIVAQINNTTIDFESINRNEQKLLVQLFTEFRVENFVKPTDELRVQIEQSAVKWFEEVKSNSSDRIQAYLQTTTIDNLYESFERVKEYFDDKETLIMKSHYYEVICKQKIDFWSYFLSVPFDETWKHFRGRS